MDHLEGTIERITYQNDETGYTIAKLKPKDRSAQEVTVIGEVASISPGESVALTGMWITHPRYGRQFKIVEYQTVYPASVEGIRKYLGSGLIKGIGPISAKRIVNHFGLDTLRIIEEDIDCLSKVEGIGPKRVQMIKNAWEAQKHVKEVMLFLQSHNVSTAYAVKIYKHYGNAAIQIVKHHPYRLATDIWGIGFITADKIARNVGIEAYDQERIQAGMLYVVNQYTEQGHMYVPADELIQEASKTLSVSPDKVSIGLGVLEQEKRVIIEGDKVYLPPFFFAELGVAKRLHILLEKAFFRREEEIDVEIKALERIQRITFTARQKQAIQLGLTGKVIVLTGGPGTGKTTTLMGLIALLERRGLKVMLGAPTGRAAKKLSEVTGRTAKTIHRMLGFSPQKNAFLKDQNDPLETDVVVIDEVSMIDTILMNSLLKAISPDTSLILVGDADQCPSDLCGGQDVSFLDANCHFFVPVSARTLPYACATCASGQTWLMCL